MAEEILVKESLSDDMISTGAELAHHLHTSPFRTDALLWFYVPETNTWRFVIASPEVRSSGPKKVYQEVRSIISGMPASQHRIPFDDIVVVDSNDPLISLLRTAVPTGQNLVGIRFSQNIINGVLVDDTYIYKLN